MALRDGAISDTTPSHMLSCSWLRPPFDSTAINVNQKVIITDASISSLDSPMKFCKETEESSRIKPSLNCADTSDDSVTIKSQDGTDYSLKIFPGKADYSKILSSSLSASPVISFEHRTKQEANDVFTIKHDIEKQANDAPQLKLTSAAFIEDGAAAVVKFEAEKEEALFSSQQHHSAIGHCFRGRLRNSRGSCLLKTSLDMHLPSVSSMSMSSDTGSVKTSKVCVSVSKVTLGDEKISKYIVGDSCKNNELTSQNQACGSSYLSASPLAVQEERNWGNVETALNLHWEDDAASHVSEKGCPNEQISLSTDFNNANCSVNEFVRTNLLATNTCVIQGTKKVPFHSINQSNDSLYFSSWRRNGCRGGRGRGKTATVTGVNTTGIRELETRPCYYHENNKEWRAKWRENGVARQKTFSARVNHRFGYTTARKTCEWIRQYIDEHCKVPTDLEIHAKVENFLVVANPEEEKIPPPKNPLNTGRRTTTNRNKIAAVALVHQHSITQDEYGQLQQQGGGKTVKALRIKRGKKVKIDHNSVCSSILQNPLSKDFNITLYNLKGEQSNEKALNNKKIKLEQQDFSYMCNVSNNNNNNNNYYECNPKYEEMPLNMNNSNTTSSFSLCKSAAATTFKKRGRRKRFLQETKIPSVPPPFWHNDELPVKCRGGIMKTDCQTLGEKERNEHVDSPALEDYSKQYTHLKTSSDKSYLTNKAPRHLYYVNGTQKLPSQYWHNVNRFSNNDSEKQKKFTTGYSGDKDYNGKNCMIEPQFYSDCSSSSSSLLHYQLRNNETGENFNQFVAGNVACGYDRTDEEILHFNGTSTPKLFNKFLRDLTERKMDNLFGEMQKLDVEEHFNDSDNEESLSRLIFGQAAPQEPAAVSYNGINCLFKPESTVANSELFTIPKKAVDVAVTTCHPTYSSTSTRSELGGSSTSKTEGAETGQNLSLSSALCNSNGRQGNILAATNEYISNNFLCTPSSSVTSLASSACNANFLSFWENDDSLLWSSSLLSTTRGKQNNDDYDTTAVSEQLSKSGNLEISFFSEPSMKLNKSLAVKQLQVQLPSSKDLDTAIPLQSYSASSFPSLFHALPFNFLKQNSSNMLPEYFFSDLSKCSCNELLCKCKLRRVNRMVSLLASATQNQAKALLGANAVLNTSFSKCKKLNTDVLNNNDNLNGDKDNTYKNYDNINTENDDDDLSDHSNALCLCIASLQSVTQSLLHTNVNLVKEMIDVLTMQQQVTNRENCSNLLSSNSFE